MEKSIEYLPYVDDDQVDEMIVQKKKLGKILSRNHKSSYCLLSKCLFCRKFHKKMVCLFIDSPKKNITQNSLCTYEDMFVLLVGAGSAVLNSQYLEHF